VFRSSLKCFIQPMEPLHLLIAFALARQLIRLSKPVAAGYNDDERLLLCAGGYLYPGTRRLPVFDYQALGLNLASGLNSYKSSLGVNRFPVTVRTVRRHSIYYLRPALLADKVLRGHQNTPASIRCKRAIYFSKGRAGICTLHSSVVRLGQSLTVLPPPLALANS